MKRVEEAILKKVEESLQSEKIKMEILKLLEEGRKRLNEEVAAQLEKEKEASIIDSKEKEVMIPEMNIALLNSKIIICLKAFRC